MTTKQRALYDAIRGAHAAGVDPTTTVVHQAYGVSTDLGLYASAVNMLYKNCPRGQQVTCVFIRRLSGERASKEWILLTAHDGECLNITGYLAECGIGTYTRDNRLRTTQYAAGLVQNIGRFLYDDDNALACWQA